MIGLTSQQRDLLAYIKGYLDRHPGISPSFAEMRLALGIKSKSGIHRLLGSLEERGHIRRIRNRARAIEIVAPNPLQGVSTAALMAELDRRGASPANMALAA